MRTHFVNIEEANLILSSNNTFIVAAKNDSLTKLNKGHWIGGATEFFMTNQGGVHSQDMVFMTELPSYIKLTNVRLMDKKEISKIYTHIPANGFGFTIIPASSDTLLSFALNAPRLEQFATKPLIGWVAGVLNNESIEKGLVINGLTGETTDSKAVVLYASLPNDYICDIYEINMFHKKLNSQKINFIDSGFSIKNAKIENQTMNFAEFLLENKIDIKTPLVTSHAGAQVNVSIHAIDIINKSVSFYGPVFTENEYYLANPVKDYVTQFNASLPNSEDNILFSCNCILNYLYGHLAGKKTGSITGPISYGEIGYQLLNQTMVNLTVHKKAG